MYRQYFVPGQNSRHRVAALALYRALLRTGQKVPLPKDIWNGTRRHPVNQIVRKRFVKNKSDTSLRLVYSSMSAGYNFLSMLTKGQTKGTLEHSEIVKHLQKRKETASVSRSKANHRPLTTRKRHNPPLLTKVSAPGTPAKYESTVRPLPKSAFVGERKTPVFCSTAEGQPFLRIKKPQPRTFTRAISRKTMVWRQTVNGLKEVEEFGVYEAKQEDGWDAMMDEQMKLAGKRSQNHGKHSTFYWTTRLTEAWYKDKLTRHWKDWIARGKAVHEILEQESELAMKEKESGVDSTDAKTARETLEKILQEAHEKQEERQMKAKQEGLLTFKDPFMSEEWTQTVRKMEQQNLAARERKAAARAAVEQATDPRRKKSDEGKQALLNMTETRPKSESEPTTRSGESAPATKSTTKRTKNSREKNQDREKSATKSTINQAKTPRQGDLEEAKQAQLDVAKTKPKTKRKSKPAKERSPDPFKMMQQQRR